MGFDENVEHSNFAKKQEDVLNEQGTTVATVVFSQHATLNSIFNPPNDVVCIETTSPPPLATTVFS